MFASLKKHIFTDNALLRVERVANITDNHTALSKQFLWQKLCLPPHSDQRFR